MSCHLYRSLASDQLDEQLPREQDLALAGHRALCRDCARAGSELRALRRLLAGQGAIAGEEARWLDDEADIFAEARRHPAPLRSLWWRLVGALLPRPLLPTTVAAAVALMAVAATLALPAPPDPEPPPVPAGYPALYPREASLLTVWDSAGGTVVTAVDPSGLTRPDDVQRLAWRDEAAVGAVAGTAAVSEGVRIFLFERIVVRG